MAPGLSTEQFAEGFLSIQDRLETNLVDIGGEQPLPVRGWPSPGAKTLVIRFHGAANRTIRKYPMYAGYRNELRHHAHQLAISDSSLALTEKLSLGWFAGSHGTPLQHLLPPFLTSLIERLQVEKVIFTGGSGGGFAALYYSWLFPGSAAVVAVPQTNINGYSRSHRENFLRTSWPDAGDANDDLNLPCLDLRDIYSKGMDNAVVYLQSNMDVVHIENQMTPFLGSLPRSALRRLVLKCSFWGKVGHSGSVPSSEVVSWMRAVMSAEEMTSESINLAYHLTHSTTTQSPPRRKQTADRATTSDPPSELDSVDRQLTSRLAAHMLA